MTQLQLRFDPPIHIDRTWGWIHRLPEASRQTALAQGLFLGRLLQGLRDRRLARSVRGVGKLAWELTDDGRYEARKLERTNAEGQL